MFFQKGKREMKSSIVDIKIDKWRRESREVVNEKEKKKCLGDRREPLKISPFN